MKWIDKLKAKLTFPKNIDSAYVIGYRDGATHVIKLLRDDFEKHQVIYIEHKGRTCGFLSRQKVLMLVGKDFENKLLHGYSKLADKVPFKGGEYEEK